MGAHLNDWANLLVRWVHLIAGIAWIGSSFYFIWLDSALTAPDPKRQDVEGELWMTHSGGFYQVEKRLVGPGRMPKVLHWFKWEAMITWVSGLLLLAIVYYLTGGVYLLRTDEAGVTVQQAALVTLALLVAGWVVYDQLYNSKLANGPWATKIFCGLLAFTIIQLCRVFSGRAAFIHVGALLGTLMLVNVWMRILPAQQKMIDATAAGREPDFELGRRAKRRSVHNSYMTFPVLIIMLSNHFPATYGHAQNWLMLMLLIVAGAATRHVMIGKGSRARWAAVPAAAATVGLVIMTAPPAGGQAVGRSGGQENATFASARIIIQQRCQTCHSAWPTDDMFTVAPNGVVFDTPEQMQAQAARIKERAVSQETMPLMNKTHMTADERVLLGAWIEGGAGTR